MSNGLLLLITALMIGFSVNDFSTGHNASATTELIVGIGVGLNLIVRFIKEESE